jgi:cytochrome c
MVASQQCEVPEMRGIRRALLGVAVAMALCAPVPASTAEMRAPAEAVAMVKRVVERFRSEGPAPTFTAILDKTKPEFHDGDLYPFVFDMNGVMIATGSRTALVGMSLISVKDQDGRYLVQEMIAIAQGPGSGWLEYKWPNPLTKRIEAKLTYIERMGDYLVGVGIWKQ